MFFTDCKKEVNDRDKFCKYHDQKERADVAAVFLSAGQKKTHDFTF